MMNYNFLLESYISELVKDEEWQKIRSELVGTWKTNTDRNCQILKDYIGNIKTCSNKKLQIVWNYLSSSGFRIGKIGNECTKSLKYSIGQEIKRRNISFR